MKPNTVITLLLAVTLVPAIVISKPAVAQVDLSQVVTGSFNSTFMPTSTRNTPANIVISVRDFSQTDDFCGSSASFAFPRPGSLRDGFDFPHAGRQSDSFPHPGRTITSFAGGTNTYFQLPVGVRNPDLIGCVDAPRNTVFITIKPQAAPTQSSSTQPLQPPLQSPSKPTLFNQPPPTAPQTQLLMPQQNQSTPAGVSPNNQFIR